MFGGLCPGDLCLGEGFCPGRVSVQGSLSREVSVQGVSVQGGLCPGGLRPGGSVQGALSGGSLSRGRVSVQEGSLSRVSLSRGRGSLSGRPLLLVNKYTCEIITLPQTSFADSNKTCH